MTIIFIIASSFVENVMHAEVTNYLAYFTSLVWWARRRSVVTV